MSASIPINTLEKFTTFGDLLRFLRRRAGITQMELAIAVGYSDAQISRLEQNLRQPDIPTIEARFISVLKLEDDPKAIACLLDLAAKVQPQSDLPIKGTSAAASRSLTNLPILLTSFIGREKEQNDIIKLTRKYRLITLTGPGGVGKTRLSLKVSEQILADYPDGIWLVELAPLSDPELIPQTIASILGVSASASLPVTEVLINYLRAKTTLLILDNCEHLLDACTQWTDTLLKQCPKLKILVTSREALGILGEASYPVPSLGIPDGEKLLDSYREYESMRLFEERAELARFDFALKIDNASSVAQICHRLDGLPLAIELAAVHVNQFSPAEIAAQLDESFQILTGGSRTALPRQQTLRASMDWSWNLLTTAEQTLVRQLSVFSGGWSLEAAQAICDGDVWELTSSILKKSLIVMNQEGSRETRYSFHETIRQYAREKLVAAGEAVESLDRHLDYFLEFARRAGAKLFTAERRSGLDVLELEHDNLRLALRWALDHKPETALEIIRSITNFWLSRGYLAEGRSWCEAALNHAETLPHDSDEMDKARAMAFQYLASLSIQQGEHRAGQAAALESIKLARETGDSRRLARALRVYGLASGFLGDVDQLFEALHESEAICRTMDYKWELATVLVGLAGATEELHGRNTPEQVQAYRDEVIALLQGSEDPDDLVGIERMLASRSFRSGNFDEARKRAERILAHYQEMGDRHEVVTFQSDIAHALRQIGDFDGALANYHETIQGWQWEGHRGAVAHQLECFAFIAGAQGQNERAARLLGAAEALRELIGSPMTPAERGEYDQAVSSAHAQMDETAFNTAWAEGRAMTMEQAIALALKE